MHCVVHESLCLLRPSAQRGAVRPGLRRARAEEGRAACARSWQASRAVPGEKSFGAPVGDSPLCALLGGGRRSPDRNGQLQRISPAWARVGTTGLARRCGSPCYHAEAVQRGRGRDHARSEQLLKLLRACLLNDKSFHGCWHLEAELHVWRPLVIPLHVHEPSAPAVRV